MALGKRKRRRPKGPADAQESTDNGFVAPKALALYYKNVQPLRTFVLSYVPAEQLARPEIQELLDSILVGSSNGDLLSKNVKEQLAGYLRLSTDKLALPKPLLYSQVVDIAICRLFDTVFPAKQAYKPPHQLCHGFQRAPTVQSNESKGILESAGLISRCPNDHVSQIKGSQWTGLHESLGKDADILMLHLLLNCGLYVGLKSGAGNYYQLSGVSLYDLTPLADVQSDALLSGTAQALSRAPGRTPAKVVLLRTRMLYGRPALNARGDVRVGLRDVHVFNRYKDASNPAHTAHILKYVFPRQFRLHNVFSSESVSAKPKDYTLRESEISQMHKGKSVKNEAHLPRRLRSGAFEIVQSIQKRHSRCPYRLLLDYYCPNLKDEANPQSEMCLDGADQKQDATAFSTPVAQVSAFCRAVFARLIPPATWGMGSSRKDNCKTVMKKVDMFLRSRKFETMTLHEVLQGLKINEIQWLMSDKFGGCQKVPLSESKKRLELISELLYFIFDSILIPLVRSNFYVTEANSAKNKLFFFRQDVWHFLSSPSLSLQLKSYEEVKTSDAKQILGKRKLGYSQIRLLPKSTGFRPIMNLQRKETKSRGGRPYTTSSINSIMTPVHNFMTFEKTRNSELFGSSMFSVGEMFPRLKAFKDSLVSRGLFGKKLYFAKIDVTACFDTIPQEKLLKLVDQLAIEDIYYIDRHAEIRGPENDQYSATVSGKARRKFVKRARAAEDHQRFSHTAESLATDKRDTLFVDHVVPAFQRKQDLLKLMKDHIQDNIVKIGNRYYRQREGIPQGSVISTISANFVYAAFERQHLSFVNTDRSLLLRLIDDFLFITLDRDEAVRFMEVTHKGYPEFGFNVNPAKSFANFSFVTQGRVIETLKDSHFFPYCGHTIHTQTLSISRAPAKKNPSLKLSDGLTVEYGRTPGRIFHRKILAAFKIQVTPMTSDPDYNGHLGALSNIFAAFHETAEKFYAYAKSLGSQRMPKAGVQMKTIADLAEMSCKLLQSKVEKERHIEDFATSGLEPCKSKRFAIPTSQIRTLCYRAFLQVLGKRQTSFKETLAWLQAEVLEVMPRDEIEKRATLRAEELALERHSKGVNGKIS